MALKIPADLAQWQQWQNNAKISRRIKRWVRPTEDFSEPHSVEGVLHLPAHEHPQVLVVLDSHSPTSILALLRPLQFLTVPFAVWSPTDSQHLLPSNSWLVKQVKEFELTQFLEPYVEVLSAGHYLPWGAAAYRLSQERNWGYNVVQHGLLTPFAPPLPANSTLFAFSQADADFWISGRTDVEVEVVDSQLFYEAQQKPSVSLGEIVKTPVFLGQMHGAELSRASFAWASFKFCQKYGAMYRPHPSEKDKLSTITHKLWAKRGIVVDSSTTPLNELNHPVVSVFSTGVLEAAIRGIPAWVYHPNPPKWLTEFWNRYGMSRWGSEPTAPPVQPVEEPAHQIAAIIAQKLEE